MQVSIFMTHVTNYAKDRLALVLFKSLLEFVTEWTQLKLISGRPLTLGQKYFEIFPEDQLPLWTVSRVSDCACVLVGSFDHLATCIGLQCVKAGAHRARHPRRLRRAQ